ncbi:phosphoglycerate dehydrogenase [Caldicellulosiruptoraceae bacterium PP1]
MKVIVSERIAQEGVDILKEAGFEVDLKFGISHNDLLEIIENYDALIVRSVTQVNEELFARAKNLKVVGRAGNGIDNIDVDAATKYGVIVVNTPDSNTMAAAELTIGHIFCMFRNIPQAHWGCKNGDFRRNRYKGSELFEKTAGIIGLGRIGSLVATRLKACGMRVIAYDPYISDERFKKFGVEKVSFETLIKESDLITVHTPKTEETYNMITEKEFKMMKKGVRIANVARGGIINEIDLYNAIKEGIVAAAAIDVFEKEPNYELAYQEFKHPLLELDNVIITPHLGASTEEAQLNVSVSVAKQVVSALQGGVVTNAVNLPSFDKDKIEEVMPYLTLAESMGKIFIQAEKTFAKKIEIIYSGDICNMETKWVTLSLLKGYLDFSVKENVNYVNAEMIASSQGVEVIESKKGECDKFKNMITARFTTDEKVLELSGTVYNNQGRIIDFFGYKFDFKPERYMLLVQNIDKPGIIGKIGTIVGEYGINIAQMQVSRNKKGEKAVMVLEVDGIVPNEAIEKLKAVDGILRVTMAKI